MKMEDFDEIFKDLEQEDREMLEAYRRVTSALSGKKGDIIVFVVGQVLGEMIHELESYEIGNYQDIRDAVFHDLEVPTYLGYRNAFVKEQHRNAIIDGKGPEAMKKREILRNAENILRKTFLQHEEEEEEDE